MCLIDTILIKSECFKIEISLRLTYTFEISIKIYGYIYKISGQKTGRESLKKTKSFYLKNRNFRFFDELLIRLRFRLKYVEKVKNTSFFDPH